MKNYIPFFCLSGYHGVKIPFDPNIIFILKLQIIVYQKTEKMLRDILSQKTEIQRI